LKNGSTNGHQPKQQVPAASKSNGHTRASKSEGAGPNTWQKIPKGKKKGSSVEQKSNGTGQAQSEKPPSNENERKGG